MPYERRLKALGLHSLQRRRSRGHPIEIYKILTDKEKVNSHQLFQKATTTELRGHSLKLYKKRVSDLNQEKIPSAKELLITGISYRTM